MTMQDTVTVVRARGRRLAKLIGTGGVIEGYDAARLFDLTEEPVADLDGLVALLVRLAARCDQAVVRGAILAPAPARGVRRLLHRDPETGDGPTLREAPRRWLALDLDGLPLPAGADPRDLEACHRAVLPRLPPAFRGASAVVQATASHGIKPDARLRLWCWLSRPAGGAELKAWLRAAPVDHSVFGAAQPIYTARPSFAGGAADPLPARLLLVPGARGVVSVPAPGALLPAAPRARASALRGSPADDGRAERRMAALLRFTGAAPPGRRNASLYWAARRAGELVAAGRVARGEAACALAAAGERAGLTAREAAATAESGLRAGTGETVTRG